MDEIIAQAAEALARSLVEHNIVQCIVVLQFPDEHLQGAVRTTDQMRSNTSRLLNERQFHCEVEYFVLADSNYGNIGADDISAMHVSSETSGPTILVRFGQVDLTTAGALPLMLVPGHKHLPPLEELASELVVRANLHDSSRLWVIYEAGYFNDCALLSQLLESRGVSCVFGSLPASADLSRWSITPPSDELTQNIHRIGGLEYPSSPELSDTLIYIGGSESQLLAINMQYPQHSLVQFNPNDNSWFSLTGAQVRAYKQRAFAIQVR